MSYTNWGMNEPTQDTIHFKNKISSQDAQLAAQQSQLLKQADELKQLQINLSDASAKLAVETNKNIGLGNSLARCKNDLVQERTILANTQMSLTSAQVRIKESEHEARSLQVTLESFSQSSGSALSRLREAEKDKEAARSRVLELESQVRHLTSLQAATQATPSSRNRSRSSSLSTVRISSLESETNDLRHNITQKDVHITDLTARLSSALAERNQAQNERIAVERKLNGEISDLKSHLEDRDDEMAFLRDQTRGSGARELELMQRIDEDAERIGSLELLLRSEDPRELRSQVTTLEHRLSCETTRLSVLQEEKDRALVLLAESEARVTNLQTQVNDLPTNPSPNSETTTTIETLLAAVERLRRERDDLRRKVEFLEPESRFALMELEAQTADHNSTHRYETMLLTFTLVMDYLSSQLSSAQDSLTCLAQSHTALKVSQSDSLCQSQSKVSDLQDELARTADALAEVTRHRDDLLIQLSASQEARQEAELCKHQLESQVAELEKSLEDSENTHSSLSLRINHLERDVTTAQGELADAESRYSALQFHQLSQMSSTEATKTLKNQIRELEARVLRRTEQIGLHQHDIGKLETNLRVAEERVSEMIAELDMVQAQKEAMVEDCADARDARDTALARVELLEDELEELEASAANHDEELQTMVRLVFKSVSQFQQLDHRRTTTLAQLASVETSRDTLAADASAAHNRIQFLQTHAQSLQEDLEQATITLALTHNGLAAQLGASISPDVKETLESQIASLQTQLRDELAHSKLVKQELACLREETLSHPPSDQDHLSQETLRLDELSALREELSYTVKQLEDAQHSLVEVRRQSDAHELTAVAAARQELSNEIDGLQAALASSEESAGAVKRSLAELTVEKQELEERLMTLEREQGERIRELELRTTSVQAELEKTVQQLSYTARQLQDETEARQRDVEAHKLVFSSAKSRADHAEEEVLRLERQTADSAGLVVELSDRIKNLEQQDLEYQKDVTTMSAEIHKSKSLSQYLEVKLGESEKQISRLQEDMKAKQAAFDHLSEHKNRLEGKLSLETIHSSREIERLQRQLESLSARPDLEAALDELEKRNVEMEELLRQKCAEIEENDDRVLERLKENKKLNTKVETLTRKVQNLQSKLAAVKASALPPLPAPITQPATFPEPSSSHMRQRSTTLAGTSAAPPAIFPTPPSAHQPSPTRINSSTRCLSGPSSLPRPKTPERRLHGVQVARTPEARAMEKLLNDPMPTPSAIGKKRPAPEDFEVIRSQAFTVESKPSEPERTTTPRARKVLSSIQSGFTPTRNHAARPIVPMPSPKQDAPSSMRMATNNSGNVFSLPPAHHSADQPTKRGWLGKIRGTSSHSTPTQKGVLRPAYTMTH